MRKLITLLLILISISASGQNIISISFQPIDLGLGLKYDYQFDKFGIYTSYSKGKYNVDDLITNHSKVSIGGLYFLKNNYLNLGLCLHYTGKTEFKSIYPIMYKKITFEFGSHVILDHIVFGFRFDPLHGESAIDLGFKL